MHWVSVSTWTERRGSTQEKPGLGLCSYSVIDLLIIKLTSLGWLQDSSEKLDAKRLYNWFYWSSGGRERSLRLGENSLAQPQNFTVLALLKKPDATEHSLIIENDESVFDARVVTFFQECRLLWAPGRSAGDYFWGWEHCALLINRCMLLTTSPW